MMDKLTYIHMQLGNPEISWACLSGKMNGESWVVSQFDWLLGTSSCVMISAAL